MKQDYHYFKNILFTKVREVESPKRANTHDAGIDFFVPTFDSDMLERLQELNPKISLGIDYLLVRPRERVLIPSGIKVWIEDKQTALVAFNKSGVATKMGLTVGACVVDADYTGEVHISVINSSDTTVMVKEKSKLVQFIHLPILLSDIIEVSSETYEAFSQGNTDRGEGGFGSTNK